MRKVRSLFLLACLVVATATLAEPQSRPPRSRADERPAISEVIARLVNAAKKGFSSVVTQGDLPAPPKP